MNKRLNLTGQKFNRLTVIKPLGKDKYRQNLCLCLCDCGKQIITREYRLKKEQTKSCGCLRIDISKNISKTHGLSTDKNGKTTRLFTTWVTMKQRCLNPNSSKFYLYGKRGITICKEWMNYKTFHTWAMSHGYKDNLTIERKNNNGNYNPSNCEWIIAAQQARNKRNNRFITYKGQRKTLAEWSEFLQINHSSLIARLKKWTLKEALTTPPKKDKRRKPNENQTAIFEKFCKCE